MDLYTKVAYDNSRHLTLAYSTSFGISSKMLAKTIRNDIYAIYALVRIADEIVDTYKGTDALTLLNDLETLTYVSLTSGYSTDLTVHAFAQTARRYGIDRQLIAPFFASMRMDLSPQTYSDADYSAYIHGSAEVVGLLCLKVFTRGDSTTYESLATGAAALGSAYQKVNFLRDMASDYKELGRVYFPGVSFDQFDEAAKTVIIADIKKDFASALPSLKQLPRSSRTATLTSYVYYTELTALLERTPVQRIKTMRVRVPTARKLFLLLRTYILGANAL